MHSCNTSQHYSQCRCMLLNTNSNHQLRLLRCPYTHSNLHKDYNNPSAFSVVAYQLHHRTQLQNHRQRKQKAEETPESAHRTRHKRCMVLPRRQQFDGKTDKGCRREIYFRQQQPKRITKPFTRNGYQQIDRRRCLALHLLWKPTTNTQRTGSRIQRIQDNKGLQGWQHLRMQRKNFNLFRRNFVPTRFFAQRTDAHSLLTQQHPALLQAHI